MRLGPSEVNVNVERCSGTVRRTISWNAEEQDSIFNEVKTLLSEEPRVVITILKGGSALDTREFEHVIWKDGAYVFDFGTRTYLWNDAPFHLSKNEQEVLYSYFVERNTEPRMSMTVRNIRRRLGNTFLQGWYEL